MKRINHNDMRDIGTQILIESGTNIQYAELVINTLVDTSLKGIHSHGINLLPRYVDSINTGKIKPNKSPKTIKDTNTSISISGEYGFGQVATQFAIEQGIKKALKNDMAIVGLHKTNHIGTLGQYNEYASVRGLMCISVCNGGANVAPHGGNKRYLGTNPISFSTPINKNKPLVVDFATSVYPESKIREYRDNNLQLPDNIILDKNGLPSNNPNDFYDGGSILPIGNHKGYGLSLMVEILGGLFTGAGFHGLGESTSTNGVMFMLFKPDLFQGQTFFNSIGNFINKIKSQSTIDGVEEILIPGELELKRTEDNLTKGIHISSAVEKLIQEEKNG